MLRRPVELTAVTGDMNSLVAKAVGLKFARKSAGKEDAGSPKENCGRLYLQFVRLGWATLFSLAVLKRSVASRLQGVSK